MGSIYPISPGAVLRVGVPALILDHAAPRPLTRRTLAGTAQAMRASAFIGTSVDGFIARPDGALDFLPAEPEDHGYNEFFATVDALVIGRNTYETVLGFGDWPYGSKPVFVLSTQPLAPAPA